MQTFYTSKAPRRSGGLRYTSLGRLLGALSLPLLLAGPAHSQTNPPAASVSVKVQVPASMRSAPFDVDRYFNVPPDFSLSVYARVSKARFMAVAPNGDLLVSQPSTGKVILVRPNGSSDPLVSDFVTGLRNPHDIVFHTIGSTTYVYIAESHQINRYTYTNGNLTGQNRQIVITGLPDASTPELQGNYGHQLKNIALDSNNKLYVSIASTCNACLSDTQSDPIRGSVYQYNADGTGRRLFAQGLRNAEGLAFVPGTNNLWVVVNNRDNIAYPFNNDYDGDGTNDYGKVLTSYVDNHPPEEFTYVQDGGNYGWPFCNPNPDNTLNDMPFDRDYEFNRDGAVDCNGMTRISRGIQAHSAPLGLSFMQGTNFAAPYRASAVTALHGSWNRSVKTGYKVVYFPWDASTQRPTSQQDLVTGFLVNGNVVGRPVDAVVDRQGDMLISDDHSGTIYKLSYRRAPENPANTSAGLNYEYYEGAWSALPNFNSLTAIKTGSVSTPSLAPRNRNDDFGFRYTGYIQVPTDGLYTFYTSSDDGSQLFIGNQLVVNNDGLHGTQERSGTVSLRAGLHAVSITFFERGGGEVLDVSYAGPGISKQVVPASAWFRTSLLRTPDNPANTVAGLSYQYYEGTWDALPNFSSLTAVKTGTISTFSLAPRNRDDSFGFRYSGFISVPTDGEYTFYTNSDDGSQLFIGNQLVVNNDGLHAAQEQSGKIGLKAGVHAVSATFFEKYGQQVLDVSYAGPGISKQVVPATALSRSGTAAATTAPSASKRVAAQPLEVFPNPANGRVTLNFEAEGGQEVAVEVLDVLSRVVLRTNKSATTSGRNQLEIDTRQLVPGTYNVRLTQAGQTAHGRLVIAR
ncbi:PA14 domain-containing protein [Hymenobacter weizhouensis]|uniref:PA14 domain-containing protein n=1 Tax=Hymenobacter sp. YIM 151500-1 TaxID=2987689 RepID=UPI0022270EF0|nr:PA14 domain-containing protein [Hymenobacter sp. YIM 151500-1]UYZ64288.1 PA14 domain-containing protein [Hymenobacter sp. YIM 151500-1]